MATITDIVITDDSIDDTTMDASEGTDIGTLVVKSVAIAAGLTASYFGLSYFFGSSKEEKPTELLTDHLVALYACDTPAVVK